jgi:CDP-diglyceride synthetase
MIFIICVVMLLLISCMVISRKCDLQGRIKITVTLALIFSLIITVDLGYNYFYSTIESLNDGITIKGFFAAFIFGDSSWSVENYFKTFAISVFITSAIICLQSVLSIVNVYRKHTKMQ